MIIEFRVRDNNGNKVAHADKQEAVRQFLHQFKSRTFRISEFRDGVHTRKLLADDPANCLYREFASRDEARAFCNEDSDA